MSNVFTATKRVVGALVLAVHICPATAQTVPAIYRASVIFASCQSDNAADRARCEGFVAGTFSTLADPVLSRVAICPPESSDIVQLVLVTQKYMREHPEILHYSASGVVAAALKTAFPCR